MNNIRHVCTKEDPYDKEKHNFAEHPDAEEIELSPNNSSFWEYEEYKCPHCGIKFKLYYDDMK